MIRLDGTVVAEARRQNLTQAIAAFQNTAGRKPGLAVILVGDNPASQVYVRNKVKTAEAVGILSTHIFMPSDASFVDVEAEIDKLNRDPLVDGILLQLPLPAHLNAEQLIDKIDPRKDPDGLTTENLGLLFRGSPRVAPCTPWGVIAILAHYEISLHGRRACVIGRSNIVGKPMAQLLMANGATVTNCHSATIDLMHHTRDAEIVVVAAGRPRMLGREAFAKGAVVIDVGIHRLPDGKLCGDVRYDELQEVAAAATPVPKGVGPMTIQMLLENTLKLAELCRKN